jgi:prolyl oligopeptidase
MHMSFRAAACVVAIFLSSCSTAAQTGAPSPSGTGVMTTDANLWLEEVEGEEALAWVRAQNERSLAVLEGDDRYAGLLSDALALANSQDRLPLGGIQEGYYYNFWQDETHVRGIWRRSRLDAFARNAPVWETLLDVDALSAAEDGNWVFKGADCLEGSTRCMVALSVGGRDAVTYREFDIATGAFVEGGFVIPEAKSSIAWVDADTLLVGTDWGEGTMTESGYAYVIRSWRRGTPLASAVEVMRGQATDVGVFVGLLQDTDGAIVPIAVEADTFFESTTWRLDGPEPQRFTLPPKATVRGLYRGRLIATIEQDWTISGQTLPSGSLIAMPLAQASSAAPNVELLMTPSERQSIEGVAITNDAVLVGGYENVRGRLLRFTLNGETWAQTQVTMPPNGSIGFAGSAPTEALAFVVFEDYLTPDTLYALENNATSARVVRALPAQFDASPYVSEQFEAVSRDGTRVPYFVLRRRDIEFNGENPTLLYAYGGFQVSLTPGYSPYIGRMWLDRGGVYVIANIRGGGEFGPAWHQSGLRTNRQVIYDDFYAVERDLVERRITSPRRLGIMGGSNGGLLMGVMLNQHPEMVNAAVVQVPLLDMLRYDQLLAGASWVDEYGSPSNPEERAFLESISPLQNLRARDDFPVPFVLTSTKDDRVHPGHARRYVARMLELGMPVLYYENIDGGHSAAANLNEAARRRALEYTYLMQRLMD